MLNHKGHILITGVSTGIGHALTRVFINEGFSVFGTVRSKEDCKRLMKEMGKVLFTALILDVTSNEQISNAVSQVEQQTGEEGLIGIINNAGMAIGGPVEYIPMEEFKHQFEVNLFGLIDITRQFLPLIKKNPSDKKRIINIGSVSGKLSAPFMAGYVSSKHALEGLTGSWRKELMVYGIDMILIGPGSIKTPIWTKGQSTFSYDQTEYRMPFSRFRSYIEKVGERGENVDRFAHQVLRVFMAKKPKTRYAFVKGKLLHWYIPLLIPSRVYDRLVRKMLGI